MDETRGGLAGKRVFLSGPMTGMPDWNRAAFARAEDGAYRAGAVSVYNPASGAPGPGEPALPHDHYMLCSLKALTESAFDPSAGRLAPRYDAIAMLPGWERSEGAGLERAVAEAVGMEVVEL